MILYPLVHFNRVIEHVYSIYVYGVYARAIASISAR